MWSFASLMRAPAARLSSGASLLSAFRTSVSLPCLPRNRAFACSRSGSLAAAANSAAASATIASRSCMLRSGPGAPSPLSGIGRCLRRNAGLRLLGELGERRLVGHGEIRENLAVDLDRGFLEAVHEGAVAQPELARAGIDPGDPEGAELALLHAPVAIGVLPCLHDRLLGDAKDVLSPAVE